MALARKVSRQRAQFAVLEGQHAAEIEDLEGERRERKKILEAATRTAASSTVELQDLNRDAQRLETLLEELRKALADIPDDADRDAPFRSRRVANCDGRSTEKWRCGSARPEAVGRGGVGCSLRRRRDSRCWAVAAGRVAFAEWLRGFGSAHDRRPRRRLSPRCTVSARVSTRRPEIG